MKQIQKWIVPIVGVCFAVILMLMTADFVTKHFLYLQQRDLMYNLIRDSAAYEDIKGTVSYLQGAATRRLTQIKETALYFGLSFFVLFILMKGAKDK